VFFFLLPQWCHGISRPAGDSSADHTVLVEICAVDGALEAPSHGTREDITVDGTSTVRPAAGAGVADMEAILDDAAQQSDPSA